MKCNRCGRDNCPAPTKHYYMVGEMASPDWFATARAWQDCAEAAGKRAMRAEAKLLDLRASLARCDFTQHTSRLAGRAAREAVDRDEDAQREAWMRSAL
jgi:hypothetical protein